MNLFRISAIYSLVLAAVFSRLIPHPPNFTSIAAVALLSGAHFGRKWSSFFVVFGSMLVTDAIFGFHDTMPFAYLAFGGIIALGALLRARSPKRGLVPPVTGLDC